LIWPAPWAIIDPDDLKGAPRAADEGDMKRKNLLASILFISLSACSSVPMVLPDRGQMQQGVQGVHLRVLPSPWTGEPHDLPTHLLPVAVELLNRGPSPIEVSLGDFSVVESDGAVVRACLLDQVLQQEPPGAPPLRGPTLAMTGTPLLSADADAETALRGPTSPPLGSDAVRVALQQRVLRTGELARGFLYFRVADPGRPRSLRLRWQGHKVGGVFLGETDLPIRIALHR
jgi:hypothetical protein